MNTQVLESHVSELLHRLGEISLNPDFYRVSKILSGAISSTEICYGPTSAQCSGLVSYRDKLSSASQLEQHSTMIDTIDFTRGVLEILLLELDAGLIGNLQQQIAGEVLGDLIELATAALSENTPGTINVAAVLVAASYEDTIRRMGTQLAGISNKPKLEKVQNILKEKDLLRGSEVSALAGFLKFRNDALHADWDHIEKTTVHSCLSFVEQLLLKHFS